MKRLTALLMALIMVLSLTACGGSGETTQEPETPAPVETQNEEIANVEVEQASAQAEKITVQIAKLDDFGPFIGTFGDGLESNGSIMLEIYQTLASRNNFGEELKNVLMESYVMVDEWTYDVTLYDGIYDSAGNSIKASDVKFSFEKYKEYGESSLATKNVGDVEVISDLVVRIHVVEGSCAGTFERILCDLRVVSEASFNASPDAMATTAVGSGPYKLEKFVSGSQLTLVANDNYWCPEELRDASVEMQNVKVIDCQVLTESAQIAMALQTNKVDISQNVNAQDLPSFQAGGAYATGHGVYTKPSNAANVLMFNCSADSPLQDEKLREAVMYAIDSDLIAATVNGGNNVVAYCMGGPTYGDYQEKWSEYYPPYDIEAAKAAIAESAYPNGCDLKLVYIAGNTSVEDTGVVLQAMLSEIGINLTLEGLPFPQYRAAEGTADAWNFCIANLSNSGNLIGLWNNYFNWTNNGGDRSKNFYVSEELQNLVTVASSVEGYTDENMDALWKYIMDHNLMYALNLPMLNFVYNSDLITGFGFNHMGSVVPGACTYNVQ